jgi:signal transduction histidine kinase
MRRPFRELPQGYVDLGLATTLFMLEMFNLYSVRYIQECDCRFNLTSGAVLVTLSTLPLALRSKDPFRIGFLAGSALVVAGVVGVPTIGLGGLVSVYTASSLCTERQRKVVVAVLVCALLLNPIVEGDFEALPEDVVMYAGAWVLGALVRTRRAYTEELELRAADLERERDTRASLAVAEERRRIARELHDLVAHAVGVMVVQATAARSVLPSDSTTADASLGRIESIGRSSLVEMRRLLEVLRSDAEAPSRGPQPGLDSLPELLHQMEDSGVHVTLAQTGDARPLPSGTDLSVFRIIQEALTNVLKHAHTSQAHVALDWGAEELSVQVSDSGRGWVGSAEGHGLRGMRERVSMLEGQLKIAGAPNQGFSVLVRIPVGGAG